MQEIFKRGKNLLFIENITKASNIRPKVASWTVCTRLVNLRHVLFKKQNNYIIKKRKEKTINIQIKA